MDFDVHTLVLLLIIGNFVSAAVLLAYKSKFHFRRPFSHFMAGKFLQTASWILVGFRGKIPDVYSIYLANFIMFSGFAFEAAALCGIEDISRKTEYVFIALTLLFSSACCMFPGSPGYRVANASLFIAVLFAAVTYRLLSSSQNSSLKLVIGTICGLFSISLCLRAYSGLIDPMNFSLFSANIINSLAFLAYFPLLFGTVIGFVLLLKERDDILLAESEEKFSNLFHSSPTPIILSDMITGEIIEINPSFEEISGYKAAEITGRTIFEINLWADSEDRLEVIDNLKKGNIVKGDEYRFRNKSGGTLIGILNSVIITMHNRKLFLSSIQDISQRKQNEIKLKEYSQELQTAKSTKEKFFSIIAHDLRSPFQTLLNASELLSKDIDSLSNDEIKELSSGLNSSIKKQFFLLTDLLNWTRLQAKNFVLNRQDISLKKITDEVIEPLLFTANEKGIKIQNDIPADLSVTADDNMLKLVIRNLAANSIKFTTPGGSVRINAYKNEAGTAVSVADNGVGISPEDISKLFRDDLRFSTSGTKKEEGSGLGLILCKEIIEKHGGRISVESKAGEGSTFTFTIP
jgi:PAS domain S-box-containing protein